MLRIRVELHHGLNVAYAVDSLDRIWCGYAAGQTGTRQEAIRGLRRLVKKNLPMFELEK